MSEGKKTTEAMPQDGREGAPDGVNTQGKRGATGGSGAGAPYPNPHAEKSENKRTRFADGVLGHGGQSTMGYHGSQQLGDDEVKPKGNPNAAAKRD